MNSNNTKEGKIHVYFYTIIICFLKTIDYTHSIILLFSPAIFMKKNKIFVWKFFKKSWETLLNHFRGISKLLILTAAPMLLVMALEILLISTLPDSMLATSAHNSVYLLEPRNSVLIWLQVLWFLASIYFLLGLLKAQIKLIHGERPTEKLLFSTKRKDFLQFILAIALWCLIGIVLVAIISWSASLILWIHNEWETIKTIKYIFLAIRVFFIITAFVYFGIRFQFFKFFIAKWEKTIAAFKKSRWITECHEWKILYLMCSYVVIIFAAFLIWITLFVLAIWFLGPRAISGGIGWIASIITIFLLVIWYLIIIVFAYATKELSLTQAFLELSKEE